MDNLSANNEPKKIFLTKPPETFSLATNETTAISNASSIPWRSSRGYYGEQVRIPPRRHQTPMDKSAEEHLSNHKKQRYWNSWEELYLVELWRRYKDEVTMVNVPLPVYRKMMVAMRNRNMLVTAQDCRRKINTLNTKYKQELARVESTGIKSDWRLFNLIHCVMKPKVKEYDPWHENVIIKKLLDKIPKPVEVPSPALINNNYNSHYNLYFNSHQARSNYPNSVYNCNPPSGHYSYYKISIYPFRNITEEKLEQLRLDNNRLAEQRDADLKRLQLEEENFQNFEKFIRIWTEQKEADLRRVKLMAEKTVVSIENAENHNMEQQQQSQQQLQEAVVAQ
ncbi:uncharacterized protein ACRADG_005161 [Cochliomyia hominivorax]